ncbi:SpoIIIAH-like family protein [Oscillibacter sp.]|uniref:SpoIIIAH-like family protein n=1 Tax=Oscillibacter sp. TaxID=1945593 RepID=UPI0025DF1943|nr:SpoIIIAH-like family protein [Oscillibacter sp.]
MRGNWKRYTVVVTMLVLICAAAALNWQATQNAAPTGAGSSGQSGGKLLGEAALVSGGDGSAAPVDETGVYTGSDYFASARLTRQQARDSAVSLLQQAAEEDGASQGALDQAAEGIQAMAQFTMAEAQIENLVTAKGYTDCVAFMSEDSLSVVVSTASGELADTDVAKITDIAMTETGYPAGNIKIMAAN